MSTICTFGTCQSCGLVQYNQGVCRVCDGKVQTGGKREEPQVTPGRPAILDGIQVMKNDMLPPMTMMVSPDLYARLTDTPEQAEAKHQAILANLALMSQLMHRAGAKRPCQQPQAHPSRCGCEVLL